MTDKQYSLHRELKVRKGQALVPVPDEENGEPVTRVYVRDMGECRSRADDETFHRALGAIGV